MGFVLCLGRWEEFSQAGVKEAEESLQEARVRALEDLPSSRAWCGGVERNKAGRWVKSLEATEGSNLLLGAVGSCLQLPEELRQEVVVQVW